MMSLKRGAQEEPNWSELLPDLLKCISSKLPCPDVLRFKSVCSSWHDAAERVRSGPLLMFPSSEEKLIRIRAFSIRDKTTYDLNWDFHKSNDVMRMHEDLHFVGSSHGWMIALNKHLDLLLYNFFSRKSIHVSGKRELQEIKGFNWPEFLPQENLIWKAVLTANPSSSCNETYKVVIMPQLFDKLAFRGKGDATWTVFGDSKHYMDVMSSDGMVYALSNNGNTIERYEFSNNTGNPSRKMCITLESPIDRDPSLPDNSGTKVYLVPSKEEILYIERYIGLSDNKESEIDCCYKTLKFGVFRLDRIEEELVRVESLQDQVIFLGGNNGISLPSIDYQGFKPNSIYFNDDSGEDLYGGEFCALDNGVFSLEDGSISKVYVCNYSELDETVPFWVLDNFVLAPFKIKSH